ncbi:MAG: hypothetical protein LBR16_04205 [Treponema sp.]|nr:hypothetical protein [Treponema sp.]
MWKIFKYFYKTLDILNKKRYTFNIKNGVLYEGPNFKERNMKKWIFLAATLVVALAAAGCGTTAPATQVDAQGNFATPEWFDELPPQTEIWGTGSAQIRNNNIQFARTDANNAALVEIARQIDSTVQAMFTDYAQQAGTADNPNFILFKENVSRTVTNQKISGATPIKQKTVGNTLWVRLSLSKADAKKAVESIFTSEAAQYAEFKKDQALQLLDAQLAKPAQ